MGSTVEGTKVERTLTANHRSDDDAYALEEATESHGAGEVAPSHDVRQDGDVLRVETAAEEAVSDAAGGQRDDAARQRHGGGEDGDDEADDGEDRLPVAADERPIEDEPAEETTRDVDARRDGEHRRHLRAADADLVGELREERVRRAHTDERTDHEDDEDAQVRVAQQRQAEVTRDGAERRPQVTANGGDARATRRSFGAAVVGRDADLRRCRHRVVVQQHDAGALLLHQRRARAVLIVTARGDENRRVALLRLRVILRRERGVPHGTRRLARHRLPAVAVRGGLLALRRCRLGVVHHHHRRRRRHRRRRLNGPEERAGDAVVQHDSGDDEHRSRVAVQAEQPLDEWWEGDAAEAGADRSQRHRHRFAVAEVLAEDDEARRDHHVRTERCAEETKLR